MLRQLIIKDYTLIDRLDIDFKPGFSVITGETGAGKSIILGAIGLLLGNRADTRLIKDGKEKCTIEAHFDLSHYSLEAFFHDNDIDYDAEDTILRRELSANGKSRAFINDTPVPLTVMKQLGEQLVDIHSQHQNLLLAQENFQLDTVDIIAKSQPLLSDYRKLYDSYQQACLLMERKKQDMNVTKQNEEFMRFQYKELSEANLSDGEQEELEQQCQAMSHAEEIKSAVYETHSLLSQDSIGICGQVRSATMNLHGVEKVYQPVAELAERLDSAFIELKDISQEIAQLLDHIDFDPQELEKVNQRLDLLNTLEHKYHVNSIAELIDKRDELEEKLSHIDNSEEELSLLQDQIDKLQVAAKKEASKLTDLRTKAARTIEKEIEERLVPMGIPNVRFQVQITEKEMGADGSDKIAFLFSANKSTPLMPVSQVASGGEIARVMLALKAMISGTVKLPTIIFDEIDTGVSGRVAEKMAQIMHEMGDNDRQVISITHLPQIAALGSTHYRVSKEETSEGTRTTMTMLSEDERIREIAQMLSGSDITEAAVNNAKELLKRH